MYSSNNIPACLPPLVYKEKERPQTFGSVKISDRKIKATFTLSHKFSTSIFQPKLSAQDQKEIDTAKAAIKEENSQAGLEIF